MGVIVFFVWFVFTVDVVLGLSHVILLRCPGEDGGSAQCSGVARHHVHFVFCSGENQRGETMSRGTWLQFDLHGCTQATTEVASH